MTDVELTRALERGEIANKSFHHHSHLHVAWVYLAESSSPEEAAAKMRATLRNLTVLAGNPEKDHEASTRGGVHVMKRMRTNPTGQSLERVVGANPRFLENDKPLG